MTYNPEQAARFARLFFSIVMGFFAVWAIVALSLGANGLYIANLITCPVYNTTVERARCSGIDVIQVKASCDGKPIGWIVNSSTDGLWVDTDCWVQPASCQNGPANITIIWSKPLEVQFAEYVDVCGRTKSFIHLISMDKFGVPLGLALAGMAIGGILAFCYGYYLPRQMNGRKQSQTSAVPKV